MPFAQLIADIQKYLNIVTRIGYLGDNSGSGDPRDRSRLGNLWVRLQESDGRLSSPVSMAVYPNANINVVDGFPVRIGYDEDQREVILSAYLPGLQSTNPLFLNPLDNAAHGYTAPATITTFLCTRHGNTVDKPLYVYVFPAFIVRETETVLFSGAEIDLSGEVPATGEHLYTVVLWKTDNTLEIFSSTAKALGDPLTDADIEEAINLRSTGSLPIWAWELQGDQTALTNDKTKNVDLRQLINVVESATGGGGMTDFDVTADTGTPATIGNGDTLTLAGGTGISSAVSGNTVTHNLDDTAVTPASYTNANLTVDQQGRITAASNGTATPWTTDSNVVNLVTDGDTVTIGSNTAGGKLFIDGDADEVQLQIQGNATQTALPFVLENSGGTDQITFSNTGAAVFNEAGNDADFRVEGDTDANLFVVDASTDRIGIGTASPAAKLDVRGSASFNTDNGNNDLIVDGQNVNNVFVVDASQDAVGIGTATPAASAVLQLVSVTKGFLPPKMTDSQMTAISATNGILLYNTNFEQLYGRINTAWRAFVTDTDTQTLTNKTLTAPAIADFTNANHDHLDADDGGTLDAAAIASGTIPTARLPALALMQFSQTATTTFASNTGENSLLSTGVGSATLAANQLVAGSVIRISARGYGQRGSGVVAFRVKLGGTTVLSVTGAGPAWGANGMFHLQCEIPVRTTGATGTVYGQGSVTVGASAITTNEMGLVATGTSTIDTTGTLAIDVTCQFSVSLGTNTITCTGLLIEVVG